MFLYRQINFHFQLILTKLILLPKLEENKENKEMACSRHSLLLASLALVLRLCRRRQEEDKKRKRRFWGRKIVTEERKERGEWENLFRELSNDDQLVTVIFV